jgi:hypothetical protein
MGGFAFRLEHQDGTPAEPRTFEAAVPNWGPGDTIHLARERALRVVAVRDDDADQGPAYRVRERNARRPAWRVHPEVVQA